MTTELQELFAMLQRGEIAGEQFFLLLEARRLALVEQSNAQQQRHHDAVLHQVELQTLALEAIAAALKKVVK